MRRQLVWALGIALMSGPALAEGPSTRHIQFQSQYDQFELVLKGSTATISGKPADLKNFQDFLPLLTNDLESECSGPLPTSADVTTKEGSKVRYFYFKQSMISDGKNCWTVGGEGLVYFPIHRDFLIGSKTDSIELKSPVVLSRPDSKVFGIQQDGKKWVVDSGDQLLNWDFVDHFTQSLQDFTIRFRALQEMANGKPELTLLVGGKKYTLYKISKELWAVKKPGTHWLEASDTWSFWYDFEPEVVEDRFAKEIRFLEDPAPDAPHRLATMQKIGNAWSRNLRELYHKFVLDQYESPDVKALAFERLKGKPSLETAGVMTRYLSEGGNENLKRTATQILKIQEPKGPLYNPQSPESERAKVVDFWSHWWTKVQNQK